MKEIHLKDIYKKKNNLSYKKKFNTKNKMSGIIIEIAKECGMDIDQCLTP